MASTACSEALESWTLAAEWITESGMPLRSTITWRFEPDLPLSVGFAPLFWPPGSGHARRVQRCPLPVDLVRLAQTVQELTVQPLPHARFLPLLEASPTHQHRVGAVLDSLRQVELLSEEGWKRISAGEGSKGPCLYDWLRLPLNPPLQEGFERWLLVRRCPSRHPLALRPRLPRRHPGRRDRHRSITKGSSETGGQGRPAGVQEKARALVQLTVSEVRKLLRRLVLARRPPPREEVLRWSAWRRNHQAVAGRCHYKRRGVLLA